MTYQEQISWTDLQSELRSRARARRREADRIERERIARREARRVAVNGLLVKLTVAAVAITALAVYLTGGAL